MQINITYQDLDGKSHSHDAYSSWAALLQHECDRLDGIVCPMRMTDLSLLAYNDKPGPLAREVLADPKGITRCSSTSSSDGRDAFARSVEPIG